MTIDWFITNHCNSYALCKFCNAPAKTFPTDAPLEESLSLCDIIIERHIDVVTLCGGEPMLYPGLKVIVQKLANAGVRVILYTNGITLTDFLPTFFPYLEFLSLPLDAISQEGAEVMRGYDQVESVQRILIEIKNVSIRPRVKLGTMVSNLNYHELPELANFVMRTPVIDIWRLYQYSPGGIGLPQAKTYSIDNWEFERQITKLKEKFVGSGRIISVRTREEIIGYCMIMDAHGRFYRYDGVYHPLAVTLQSSTERINKEYNIEKHQRQKRWHNLTP